MSSEVERKTLAWSVIIVCVAALWASTMAVLTHSMAVAMDAAFNVLSAILTGMGIIIVRFMDRGFTRRHPLGFYPYEAMIAFVRSLVLSGMLVVLFTDAVYVILAGGKEVPLNIMFIYTFPSMGFCAAGFIVCSKGYQKTQTMTLEADLNEWRSSFFISVTIFLSMVISWILKLTPAARFAAYTDPAVVIFLCMVLIKEPIALVIDAFKHLMLQAADPEFSRAFRSTLRAFAERRYPNFVIGTIDVIQIGRFSWTFVEVFPKSTDVSLEKFHRFDREVKEMVCRYFKNADSFVYFGVRPLPPSS